MPQYLIIIIAIITFLKDSFKGINKKWLYGIGIGIMLYILYKRFQTSQAETLLNEAGENVLVKICTDIKDALNPYGDIFGINLGSIDGTDEDKIKVAGEALKASGKTYKELSEIWEKIYKTNLTDELNKEGVKDLFFETIAAIISPTPTNTATNTTGFKKGDIVYTKGGYNLRSTNNPYPAINTTVAGEDWILYNNPYVATIAGTKGYWVVIQQPKSRYIFYPSYFVVFLSALYKK